MSDATLISYEILCNYCNKINNYIPNEVDVVGWEQEEKEASGADIIVECKECHAELHFCLNGYY